MIFQMTEKRLELAMQALSEIKRLRLLEFIAAGATIPMTEMAGLLELSLTNCNFHLKKLENAELINRHTSGRYVYYTLNHEMLKKITEFLTFPNFKEQNETQRSEENSSECSTLRPAGDGQDALGSDDGGGDGVSGCG